MMNVADRNADQINNAALAKTTKKDVEIDAKEEGVKPSASEAKDAAKATKSSKKTSLP